MTAKKAISIVKEKLQRSQQFIKEIDEENQKHPDNSLEQISNRMYLIITKMADGEINTLKKILKELETKTSPNR